MRKAFSTVLVLLVFVMIVIANPKIAGYMVVLCAMFLAIVFVFQKIGNPIDSAMGRYRDNMIERNIKTGDATSSVHTVLGIELASPDEPVETTAPEHTQDVPAEITEDLPATTLEAEEVLPAEAPEPVSMEDDANAGRDPLGDILDDFDHSELAAEEHQHAELAASDGAHVSTSVAAGSIKEELAEAEADVARKSGESAAAGSAPHAEPSLTEAPLATDEQPSPASADLPAKPSIAAEDLGGIAFDVARLAPHVSGISVEGATVKVTMRASGANPAWSFAVDFDDEGRVTGDYAIESENPDSDTPELFANLMSERIRRSASA